MAGQPGKPGIYREGPNTSFLLEHQEIGGYSPVPKRPSDKPPTLKEFFEIQKSQRRAEEWNEARQLQTEFTDTLNSRGYKVEARNKEDPIFHGNHTLVSKDNVYVDVGCSGLNSVGVSASVLVQADPSADRLSYVPSILEGYSLLNTFVLKPENKDEVLEQVLKTVEEYNRKQLETREHSQMGLEKFL
ncbi:hypothetical protein KY347_02775 [Candidatus Woesearchaeota archaeon]|nr:hypothetical protein [Candidatus Woesearchaeota archaeon]